MLVMATCLVTLWPTDTVPKATASAATDGAAALRVQRMGISICGAEAAGGGNQWQQGSRFTASHVHVCLVD